MMPTFRQIYSAVTANSPHYDVIIIGAGAAGLMCAITAGQRGRRVLVLETSNKIGKKILMSGGGRCNFTNLDIQADHFISHNPHFFKSALKQYTQWDFLALVNKHGVDYQEKKHQQLFCSHSAKDILTLLLTECEHAGVAFQLNTQTDSIEAIHGASSGYRVTVTQNQQQQLLSCASLVVATGGLSIPSLGGATGLGYQLAEQFGLAVLPRRAGLVPMTLSGQLRDMSQSIAGVSLPVVVSVPGQSFSEDLLFTHRGISGPSVLQLSSYWQLGDHIVVDLLPTMTLEQLTQWLLQSKQRTPNSYLRTLLTQTLPKSMVTAMMPVWSRQKTERTLHGYRDQELWQIAEQIKQWTFKPSGTEGYRTAEVTLGGVDTRYLSSKTMQVTNQPGLYFIGEVVDVTGHLGGYNFQWAWSSGFAAGCHA